MRIVISTVVWYPEDAARVRDFEEVVRRITTEHEIVIVPPNGDLLAALRGADAFFPLSGHSLTREALAAGAGLKWIHLASAGVEHALFPELRERHITLTNGRGVYAVPIAEHVLGTMLALALDIPALVRRQGLREWRAPGTVELLSSTAVIVGLGGIGREVARRCRAFGMRVLATRGHPENPDPDADRVYAADALADILPLADWLIVSAPATPETRHIVGAAELAALPPGARLVNIARGSLVDERALIAALREGRLAGAALDVFETEPLPTESPLWGMPNVIISPHNAGASPRSLQRTLDLFLENLHRFLAGEPLKNVVDMDRGY